VTGERDQLKREVADLRKKNTELESLSPILKFYGTRAKLVASYDLNKEAGSELAIGNCLEPPCFLFTMRGIQKSHTIAEISPNSHWEELGKG
jgi:hypothetical protein